MRNLLFSCKRRKLIDHRPGLHLLFTKLVLL
jgi:hypothetical protein